MSGVLVWLGIAALGGVGAVARLLVSGALRAHRRFPVGTLVVNLSGAILLGLLTGLALSDDAHRLAGTALLGSYTTFSTWMLESHGLAEEGERLHAALNVVLSLALGLGAAALGRAIAG